MKRTLLAVVVAVLAVAFVPSSALAQCTVGCGDSLPPQNPAPRTFDSFIQSAYWGAYGRAATCDERQAEFSALSSAASNGLLAAEAKRFVATLFETQASYDDPILSDDHYVQTDEYQARNANTNTDPNTNRTDRQNFVTDLYHAFLQRDPDDGGLCFWTNDACSSGRKHVIDAFVQSIEFGNLINGLTVGSAPFCNTGGGGGDCPGSGGGYGQLCQ